MMFVLLDETIILKQVLQTVIMKYVSLWRFQNFIMGQFKIESHEKELKENLL